MMTVWDVPARRDCVKVWVPREHVSAWWPVGHGGQPLYTLTATLAPQLSAGADVDGTAAPSSDTCAQTCGGDEAAAQQLCSSLDRCGTVRYGMDAGGACTRRPCCCGGG